MTLLLEREVTRQARNIYGPNYIELWGSQGRHIPTTPTLRPGDEILEILGYEVTGKAARYNGVATDIPTVSASTGQRSARVAHFITGANWTIFEAEQLEAAASRGTPPIRNLAAIKQTGMRRVLEEELNPLVIFGDSSFSGFLNQPLVTPITETANLYDLTPVGLFNYFSQLIGDYKRITRLISAQIKMLVPPDLFIKLSTLPEDSTSSRTAFAMLTDAALGASVGTIEEIAELSSAELEANGILTPGTNRSRIVIYNPDPDTLLREYYATRLTIPGAFPNGIHWQQSAFMGSSEVQLFRPYRMQYIDIPNDATP